MKAVLKIDIKEKNRYKMKYTYFFLQKGFRKTNIICNLFIFRVVQ